MKKDAMKSEYNGIRVTDSISFIIPKRHGFLNTIFVVLIALCGLIGTVFSFTTMFGIAEPEWKSVLFYTLFSFLVFTVIFLLHGKLKAVIILVLLLFAYLLYKKWDDYVYGFMIVVNKVQSVVKPDNRPIFKITKELTAESDAIVLFLGFTVFAVAFVICFATVFRPNFFLGFFITFPVIETGFYFGKAPEYIFAFLTLSYWACLLALQHSGYKQRTKRKTAGFFRVGNKFTAKPGVRFSAAGMSGLIMLSLSIFIMSMSSLFLNKIDFQRSEELNTMRLDIKKAASEFSFDDLGNSIQKISSAAGIVNFSYHSRKLGNMKKVTFGNRTSLIVESKAPINDNIYLKGYVGSVYDGGSWDVLDDSDYEEYDDFYSLCKETGDFPQDMLVKSVGLKDFANGETTEMSVSSNMRGEGSNYVPYNSVPMGNITYINDTIVRLESKKKYKFDISRNQDFENIFYKSADMAYLSDYEKRYTEFAYDKYLKIPDNEEMRELENMLIDNISASEAVGEKLAHIKSILAANAEYTLEPGKTPKNKDFVNYFLTENHKGYCVHFATSGVILARMAGIPARYTEGYVVTADDFNDGNKQSDGSYKIEIKDSRAHAWAEIYMPGYGWIPYEFTPASAAALTAYNQDEETSSGATNETKAAETAVSRPAESRITRTSSERKTTVSSAVTSSGVSKVKSSAAYKGDETDPEIYIISVTAVLTLLLIVYALVRRKYVISKRYKNMRGRDLSKASVYIYNYIMDLLLFCGHEISNAQYMDYAEYIENNTGLFKNGEFKRITEISLRAALSREDIEPEEVKFMLSSADKLAVNVYKNASVLGKLKIKFIKNLF